MSESLLILIRSILSFLVLLGMTRLMGKKQISQLTFFDYVVGITIGSIAASLSVDQNIMIANGLIGVVVWGVLPILISIGNIKSYFFRNLTDGHPTVLIENGQIVHKNLFKTALTIDELMLLLRQKNAFKLADVEFAVLETNGTLSVLKKADAQPLTPKQLGLTVEMEHDPRLVIIDGNIMGLTLREMGYSKEWLQGEIIKQGAKDFSDVFLAQLDSSGKLYVDLYKDKDQVEQPKQGPLVKASLEKMEADLLTFSLETQDQAAKTMFTEEANRVKQVKNLLNSYLKE